MENASYIIYTYILANEGDNYALSSLIRYLDEDTLVAWFYEGYFCRDEDEIIACMGEEDGQTIIDHYNEHCK